MQCRSESFCQLNVSVYGRESIDTLIQLPSADHFQIAPTHLYSQVNYPILLGCYHIATKQVITFFAYTGDNFLELELAREIKSLLYQWNRVRVWPFL